MKVKHPIKLFLLGIATILLLWIIHSSFSRKEQLQAPTTLSTYQLPVATKVVKHALGETIIPVNPQRIIVLNDISLLDPVLFLGVKPVGTLSYLPEQDFLFRGVTNDEAAGIEIVGVAGSQPNLEKILLLKPDLILMREFQRMMYEPISAIAPTVVIDLPSMNYSFKENLRLIAQILGKPETAEEVIAKYYERVKQFQQVMGERLQEIEVSVINLFSASTIGTYSINETYNQVFQDIGLKLIPILANQKQGTLVSSIEVLNKYDADVLFVLSETKDASQSFFQNPLLSTLKAAKNNRVYAVRHDRWWTYGFLGVNKLLDDLFKYLT